jgi:hypothetical protein
MILNRWGRCSSDCDSTAANAVPNVDDKAATESCTSWGRPIRFSLSRAAPPAISSICLDWTATTNFGSQKLMTTWLTSSRPTATLSSSKC